MLKNKKGAALLQVLLITVVLAGMATMLLRASLSRTSTARQTRRTVKAQLQVNSCMAKINTFWTLKSPEAFARDMDECIMYCKTTQTVNSTTGKMPPCPSDKKVTQYPCDSENKFMAKFTGEKDSSGRCKLVYEMNSDLASKL